VQAHLLELELGGAVAHGCQWLFQRIATPAERPQTGFTSRTAGDRFLLALYWGMFEVLVFVYENYWRNDAFWLAKLGPKAQQRTASKPMRSTCWSGSMA
jgi:hypothetical protein